MSERYGTDWGRGQTNVDDNGIHFGVIHSGEVCQAWSDSSEADYGDPHCPKCGDRVVTFDDDKHGEYEPYHEHTCSDYACETCEVIHDGESAFGDEPVAWTLNDGEYVAQQSGDDCDIFVLKSPYYTHAQYCSPCAPGACYLMNPTDKGGPMAYCFGHDWFDGGVAPYPVYDVMTGKLVEPDTK
jgi:hypothetical protein